MSVNVKDNSRVNIGMRTGIIGLLANLFLLLIKLFAGITAGSVSILADAMNSLGDTAGALLTIIGFYISDKPADNEHPYGHQRAEYISGLIISIIIMVIGFEFLMSSIEKIMDPVSVESSKLVFAILLFSVIIKLVLAIYYQVKNKKMQTKSTILKALIKDSLNDSLMTLVIIISYFFEIYFGQQIDGYIGAAIALYIIYSGIISIMEVANDLLGIRPSSELIQEMKEVLDSYDSIIDYHDLLIHKYGPTNSFVTVDIEMDSRWTLLEAHEVIDAIEEEFKEKFNSTTVCHLDPIVLDDDRQNEIYQLIKKSIKRRDEHFHFHDFRVINHENRKEINFDLVVPRNIKDSDEELLDFVREILHEEYGDYKIFLKFDRYYLLDE
ncbi:MAG: cation diffusion facilitator family transporter [Atopostipes suicloacalis]|nr:cation diffusion facilitator family transporter [Atopostipes suicloacalis]